MQEDRPVRSATPQTPEEEDLFSLEATALEAAPNPIIMRDNEERIIYWNKGAESVYLWKKSEAIGQRISDLLPTVYPEPLENIKNQLMAVGQWSGELNRANKGRSELLIASSWALRRAHPQGFIILEIDYDVTEQRKVEKRLREREDLYRDLVEHSSDLICTHNLEGRLLFVNELPAKVLGYTREEMLNKPMRDFLLPEARTQFDESLLTIQKEGFVKGLMVVLTKAGERRIWEYHNTLRSEGRSIPIVRGIAHDVTEQRRLGRALRESEEKFAKAFHASPVEMAIITLQQGLFLDVNEAFERNNGFSRDDLIGHTSVELGVWDDPQERAAVIKEIEKQGRLRDREIRLRTRAGDTRIKRCSAEQVEISGMPCLLSVFEDMTERKRTEQELRQLSARLLRVHDDERRKFARELHDSTGQNLVALETDLGLLRNSLPKSARKLRTLAMRCQKLANACTREARTLAFLLHPPLLEEGGLPDAVRHFTDGFTKRTGIRVNLEVPPNFGRMKKDVELALFKVVQESLTNIHKHSGSPGAEILLERSADHVIVQVQDAGRGVSGTNPEPSLEVAFPVGVGIASMKERVNLIGGRLEIISRTSGTTVRATISGGLERDDQDSTLSR